MTVSDALGHAALEHVDALYNYARRLTRNRECALHDPGSQWHMSPMRPRAPILMVLLGLVGCDHVTKFAAKAALEDGRPRQLLGSLLELRYVENTDVAFNLLRWIPEQVRRPLLATFGAVAILALGLVLARSRLSGMRAAALLAILAGALGNYLDRLFRGYVVDFIRVPHWPVFNVADILVTVGAALLFWSSTVTRPTGHTAD